MVTMQATSVAWLLPLLLSLMMVGCQLGSETQPADTPQPPPPLPPSSPIDAIGNNTKVIDGELHVWYIPCGSMPAEWVAPIIVTDLYSGSNVHLNRTGAVKPSPKPDYKTEEGKTRLEAVLLSLIHI